jgi:ribosomal protein L40E
MDAEDLARLQEWSARHQGRPGAGRPAGGDDATPAAVPAAPGPDLGLGPVSLGATPPSMVKYEAGLRVCPRCGKPVHLSATTCRECGSPVPRR